MSVGVKCIGIRDAGNESVDDRCVYLTFDDGPDRRNTSEILSVLSEYNVPATFCVLGVYALRERDLIRRMASEGHEIVNHSMSHADLSKCDIAELQYQIDQACFAIKSVCPGGVIRYFRAPYGRWTDSVIYCAAQRGMLPLYWSIDPRDWSRPGVDKIVSVVLEAARPGSVILLHDGCPPNEQGGGSRNCRRDETVLAVARLIPALHGLGLKIAALPNLE
ncbi:Nodulation protein B (Chitooligosaccharide deacetylase) [Bradyrhizobium sp. ORS 285]|nr:chitooligosaccharide deacetylase NodB [Bradyrhizobium sp. ORS 285]AAK50871.1 nodulation protein NodB [Bradyrhizobium sp. ORS 285]CCA64469.1 Nodulation protein B (Chitooligosaccharide deacetylase) [Bradyrhizobium sp. ORS 285]CCD87683.1 Nodulation protein B (Chitooligosaccharide deacetylase) [Bradyrhizobium sp. ORS 285]SMX56613.1 Nodulation protein B (Chitooligosaccharide deacetylase) [Bradyrhizobium sp. ORS 285]